MLLSCVTVLSLMSCVADCCMLHTVCNKVERFVLTILHEDYYIIRGKEWKGKKLEIMVHDWYRNFSA